MIDVSGKWALITGASRGIGRLIALEMAKQGCNLVLHSRRLSHCSSLLEQVQRLGVQAYAVEAKLSDLDAVEDMMTRIDRTGTSLDIVFNNAGVQVAYRSAFLETPSEDYIKSFAINTIAPMRICYHVLPGMVERGFGRIINTTSGIALDPQQAGYSASKAALDKVTVDLGSKYDGTNVILSLADPGWCRTDLGGPNAPNPPESALPGVLIGAFVDDRRSGRLFAAPHFSGMTLEHAVQQAETSCVVPYDR